MPEQEVRRQRKKKEEPKLEFDPGKVYGPEASHGKDFDLNEESASYRAQHGEGGTRKRGY